MAEGGKILVEVEGLDELLERFGRLEGFGVLRPAMDAAVKLLQNELAIYPPQAHKRMGGFKSDKQRRYVMMLVRTGQVPYRRTGTLGRSWTTSVETTGNDMIGRVGNAVNYGPYVMDRSQQAYAHQGVWPVAQDVAEQNAETVLGVFADAVQRALAGI